MKINDMILLPVNLWKGFASAVSVEYFFQIFPQNSRGKQTKGLRSNSVRSSLEVQKVIENIMVSKIDK